MDWFLTLSLLVSAGVVILSMVLGFSWFLCLDWYDKLIEKGYRTNIGTLHLYAIAIVVVLGTAAASDNGNAFDFMLGAIGMCHSFIVGTHILLHTIAKIIRTHNKIKEAKGTQ